MAKTLNLKEQPLQDREMEQFQRDLLTSARQMMTGQAASTTHVTLAA
jgi:hypothetical protein